jgi:S-adenosylmethionine-dependent methyltransferase
VVLCHNVIQYLDDAPAMLRRLSTLLRPGGLLSLVGMNRYSAVYAALLLHGDLAAARDRIDARTVQGIMFDAPLRIYSAPEAAAMLAQAGLSVTANYGFCASPPTGATTNASMTRPCTPSWRSWSWR